jgi:phosphatidylserine/phosphatidylglycerophosphate/cardiolipin synthase-like enzyme
LQENNVIILRSQELAHLYEHDFNELWDDGNIATTGLMDSGEATLQYKGKPAYVFVNFAPGEGEEIDENLASQIERVTGRVTLAFVVLTSGAIINALLGLIDRNVPMDGIYDWSQMEGVKHQWSLVPDNNWKIGAFERIVEYGHLVGKKSTPYTPTSQHDYMHNKVMVLDNFVVTGSYNFSRHAQRNAENVLIIESIPLADTYRQYIGGLMQRYSASPGDANANGATPPAAQAPPSPTV